MESKKIGCLPINQTIVRQLFYTDKPFESNTLTRQVTTTNLDEIMYQHKRRTPRRLTQELPLVLSDGRVFTPPHVIRANQPVSATRPTSLAFIISGRHQPRQRDASIDPSPQTRINFAQFTRQAPFDQRER